MVMAKWWVFRTLIYSTFVLATTSRNTNIYPYNMCTYISLRENNSYAFLNILVEYLFKERLVKVRKKL